MSEDEEDARIYKNIEKHGCHIIHVPEEEDYPSFTYSIGIEKSTGKPELIITGLDKDTAHFLINEYNARLKEGEVFEPDNFYEEFLEDVKITFKTVDPKHYKDLMGYASWLYQRDDFKALHFIWPSAEGTWPWEKKATKEYRWHMPRLYKS